MSTPLSLLRSARLDAWHHVLRSWWINAWMIALAVGLALILAWLYIASHRDAFRLTAQIPLGSQPDVAAESLPEFREMGWANASLLRSPDFAAQALPPQTGLTPAALAALLEVETEASTKTITVSLVHDEPVAARQALEALLRQYVAVLNGEMNKRRGGIIARLTADLETQKAEVAAAEKAFGDAVAALAGPDGDRESGAGASALQRVRAAARDAAAEEEKWRQAYESVAALEGDAEGLLGLPDIANHSSILLVKNRIREQEALRTSLEKAGDADPTVLAQVRVRIEEQNRVLRDAALQFPGLLKARHERALAARAKAEEALKAQEEMVGRLQDEGRDPETLSRAVADKRAVFAASTQRIKELQGVQEADVLQPSAFRVNFLPVQPIRIPRARIMASAAGVALPVALLIAWLSYLASPRLRTAGETERSTGMRVLAAVSRDSAVADVSGRSLEKRPQDSPAFEAFRILRPLLRPPDGGAALVVLTGCRGGEGVSTLAANLAAVYAGSGAKTLLVDLNLRRPVLSSRILGSRIRPGVSDFALGIDSLDQLATPVFPRLDLLAAGRAVATPGELMGYPWFQSLADEVRSAYEVVVFDAPAVLEVGDVLPVARFMDRALLVARSRQTVVTDLVRAREVLADVPVAVEGVLLNDV